MEKIKQYNISNLDLNKWSAFLSKVSTSTLMHEEDFLKWQEHLGNQPKIILHEVDDQIVSAAVLIDFPILTKFLYITSYFPLAPYSTILTLPGESVDSLLQFILSTKEINCLTLKISDLNHTLEVVPKELEVENHFALYIDLTQEKNKIKNSFSESLTRYLRKFQDQIKVSEIDEDEIHEVHKLFKKRDTHLGLKSFDLSYYKDLFSKAQDKKLIWLTAKIQDQIVATAIFWVSKDEIVYADGATDRDSFREIYPKAEFLIWWVIENFAQKKKRLILGEVAPQTQADSQFKKKWGALEQKYNVYFQSGILYKFFYRFQPLLKNIWRPY